MRERIYQTTREHDPYDLDGGPQKWRWHEPVAYVFPEAWAKLAHRQDLTDTHWRVLLGLVGHLDWNNRCRCTYASLGRAIGLARETVSRAMPRLVMARLVVCERQRPGQPYEVTLSPHLCWKGRPWHLARAREQFQAQWRLVHGAAAARQGTTPVPSPRVDGTSDAGTTPSILQQALDILSSA